MTADQDVGRVADGSLMSENTAQKRTRIAFITSRLEMMGGSEKNLRDLVTHLPRDNFETYVFALKAGPLLAEIQHLGVRGEELGVAALVSLKSLLNGVRLFRFLRKQQADILVTYHEDADIWGGIIAYLANVPVIISSRRDMGYQTSSKHQIMYKLINRCFTRMIAVSEAVKEEIMRKQAIPSSKICVIHNGVEVDNAEAYKKSKYLHDLCKIPKERKVVGMVASFRPVKGQEVFIRAARKVVNAYKEADYVIVGDKNTSYYKEMHQLMVRLGVEGKIHCLGHRWDIGDILKSLDIFVLSSLHEGFSNAVIEAMAAGLPVIVPNSGGNPEVVTPETGIVFEPGDIEGLTRAILFLLENDEERRIMGECARMRASDKFSFQSMLEKYEDLFATELRKTESAELMDSAVGACER